MTTITLAEASLGRVSVFNDLRVTLWYARLGPGSTSDYYPTKVCVEKLLRETFPHEDPDTRYSRIHCHTFVRED